MLLSCSDVVGSLPIQAQATVGRVSHMAGSLVPSDRSVGKRRKGESEEMEERDEAEKGEESEEE